MVVTKQNLEIKNEEIREEFATLRHSMPERFARRLNLSWSNWGFGMEQLEDSARRLSKAGLDFMELHGNHYGADLGYKADEVLNILGDYGIKVAGICGMFSADNDLSSRKSHRMHARDVLAQSPVAKRGTPS